MVHRRSRLQHPQVMRSSKEKEKQEFFAWGLNDPPPPSYRLHTQPVWRSPQKLHLVSPGYTLQLQQNDTSSA